MLGEYKEYLSLIDKSLKFDLPNNKEMIERAKTAVERVNNNIDKINPKFDLDLEKYDEYYNRINDILYFVAELSLPCFKYNEELKEYYWGKNKSNPALAIKLWQCHYMLIHNDYTTLKNRCYYLFYKLDKKFKVNSFEDFLEIEA